MDSDSSISNIKDSSYLEAKNIRVLSYGSNNDSNFKGSIKPINGIKINDQTFNIKNYSAGVEDIEDGSPLAPGTFYYKYEDNLESDS